MSYKTKRNLLQLEANDYISKYITTWNSISKQTNDTENNQ